MITLTIQEYDICSKDPQVLRTLADWHDSQATLAAAMGFGKSSNHYHDRMLELLAEATRIEATRIEVELER